MTNKRTRTERPMRPEQPSPRVSTPAPLPSPGPADMGADADGDYNEHTFGPSKKKTKVRRKISNNIPKMGW